MRKSSVILTLAVISILMLSLSFTSASWLSDFWGKITGEATATSCTWGGKAYKIDSIFWNDGIKVSPAGCRYCDSSGSTVSLASCQQAYTNGDCRVFWGRDIGGTNFVGKNGVIGLSNGDKRFLCYGSKFYECGWELNDATLATKKANGDVIGSYKCDLANRKWVENVTSTPTPDITPPVISNGTPTGIINYGEITVAVLTNENATCKINNDDAAWESMGDLFRVTGGRKHTISRESGEPFSNGPYTFYIRCKDAVGNVNQQSYVISFTVNVTGPTPTPSANITCTDSDGGLNYYVFGRLLLSYSNGTEFYAPEGDDYCLEFLNPQDTVGSWHGLEECSGNNCYVGEHDCTNYKSAVVKYACPNGCSDGACLTEPSKFDLRSLSTCSELSSFLQSPSNFIAQDGEWSLNYNNSWISKYSSKKSYYAGFSLTGSSDSAYISVNVNEVNDSEKQDLIEQLKANVGYQLCTQKIIGDQEVYICVNPWSAAYESQNLQNINPDTSKSVFWVSGNKLFEIWTSASNSYWDCWDQESCQARENYIHQRKQENLIGAFENLINNKPRYVGNFYLNWRTESLVNHFLGLCNSELEFGENVCDSSWNCKIEPVICPPHGMQKQTCTQYCNGEQNVRTSDIQCSPGICSGCYVPRWFGYNVDDNICVPYGFRLEHQIGTIEEMKTSESKERLNEATEEGKYSLIISSDTEAVLTIDGINYPLTEGQTSTVIVGKREYILDITDVHQSAFAGDAGYVDAIIKYDYVSTVPQTMNGYCDINGEIKEQKIKDSNGEWAKCQNNYECASNICSSGECIELKDIAEQANVFKAFFVKLVCKLAHPISTDEYNSCVAEYLGE